MGMRGFRPLKKPWFWKEPRFLRPGCSIIRASLTVALMVSLPRSGSLCHLRWQVPCGHLGPKGPKRPGGGERNERRARPAPTATIERPGVCPKPRQGAKGSVCPVGTWAKGPKRPEGVSKYKGCARPAHRTPIFAKGRAARMIEQPGRKKRGSSQNQGFFNDLSAALPQWKGGALRQALANLPRTLSICCCWACSLGYQPWAAIFW